MGKRKQIIIKTIILFLIGPGLVLLYFPYLINKNSDNGFGPQNIYSFFALIFWGTGSYLLFKSVKSFIYLGEGTPAPIDAPKKLVNTNVYEINRNPMYTGALLFMMGNYIWTQNSYLFIYVLIAFACMHLFVVFVEERGLKKKFGESYIKYLKEVPRWIPECKNKRIKTE